MFEIKNLNPQTILNELDEYLSRKNYGGAEEFLLKTLNTAKSNTDFKTEILCLNELMGLYRKLGRKDDAYSCTEKAIEQIDKLKLDGQVGVATTYLNCATVFKAFAEPQKSLEFYEKAKAIYDKKLAADNVQFAGLYNNMALALVDLKRFDEADTLYKKAVEILKADPNGALDTAITYLNMASTAEAKYGLEDAENIISEYLKLAENLLDNYSKRDGYYAFVCEKCATVFGYYGYFFFENELKERAKAIYERP